MTAPTFASTPSSPKASTTSEARRRRQKKTTRRMTLIATRTATSQRPTPVKIAFHFASNFSAPVFFSSSSAFAGSSPVFAHSLLVFSARAAAYFAFAPSASPFAARTAACAQRPSSAWIAAVAFPRPVTAQADSGSPWRTAR